MRKCGRRAGGSAPPAGGAKESGRAVTGPPATKNPGPLLFGLDFGFVRRVEGVLQGHEVFPRLERIEHRLLGL